MTINPCSEGFSHTDGIVDPENRELSYKEKLTIEQKSKKCKRITFLVFGIISAAITTFSSIARAEGDFENAALNFLRGASSMSTLFSIAIYIINRD